MSLAQRQASDPSASVFVSAHAGTGKTKVLVDRLLRLMLADADPARILCLTYTKAAAAEMAIRLQRRLGAWVVMPDDALDAALGALDVETGPRVRQRARALFARVLDLPGGMRIGTIHAFCQSLLRRFPLEARISPHFRLLEPSDSRAALEGAREAALPGADPDALATLAGLVNADGFGHLVQALEARRFELAPALALPPPALLAAMRRVLGVTHADEAALLDAATAWPDEAPLAGLLRLAATRGSDKVKIAAQERLDWLALPPELRREHWDAWVDGFFRAEGEPRGLSIYANPKLAAEHPEIVLACTAEQARIEAVQDQRRAQRLAEASAALLRTAAPILRGYAAAKGQRALLDYDDLIGRTQALLDDDAVGAAWVLYKLDGGLDHLLLDEVQDTAPAQWRIADRLTGDFFAGEGAREPDCLPRTIFAVGDRKQSIYAFMGADPDAFDRWRDIFGRRVRQAGLPWRNVVLDVSFRSTAPVLGLVDAVFDGAAPGVFDPGEAIRHVASRLAEGGRIELWPPTPRPEPAPATPWAVPRRNQAQTSAPRTLATHLAGWLAAEVASGAVQPGEVLVLVRRRGDFDRALVRALKAAGVPVAGLDRMVLTEQPAVGDLLALGDALLLPDDDLTFAELLTSPLGGLSDDSLMRLAAGRDAPLREVLARRAAERPDWQAAEDFFAALLARVDFAPPHALLCEALGPLGGRARLFARLGPEAAEPVDELLAAALRYAATHPPSLQGFLHWVRQSGAEITREAEAAGQSVRIMTVHGAKGLEARLVVLPDTTGLPPDERGLDWATDPGSGAALPLWQPHKALRCRAVEARRAATEAARRREYHRLLYVALTRARDRLLVCGWALKIPREGSWHELVARGMAAVGARPAAFDAWAGESLLLEAPDASTAPPVSGRPADGTPLPAWAGTAPDWRPDPLPPEPALPRPLAPSRPDGVDDGPVPPARSPLAETGIGRGGFARGLAVHALLQHLPAVPASRREAAALAYATRLAGKDAAPGLAGEALGVLGAPELAPLFGPGSRAEQPLAGLVAGRMVAGQVDRLLVRPDRVLLADYKTGDVPAGPEAVPIRYLRQMAAYRAVLAGLYPDRPVVCLLVWTDGAHVMALPDALLDSHAPGSGAA